MTDADSRELSRPHHDGDRAAEQRAARARCRAGQCCAHRTHCLPPLPQGARAARVASGEARIDPFRFDLTAPHRDGDVARVELIILAPSRAVMHETLDWLRSVFPEGYNPSTGELIVPDTLGRAIEGAP